MNINNLQLYFFEKIELLYHIKGIQNSGYYCLKNLSNHFNVSKNTKNEASKTP